MRHGIVFEDGRAHRHRMWLKTVQLQWPAAQTTLLDLESMIDVLVHRRDHLEREIVAILPTSPGTGRSAACGACEAWTP